MDFKSLLNKLDSMDAPVVTPAAPVLPKSVQLNEDAQLRVLSGRTTYVHEAKKDADSKKEAKVKEGRSEVQTDKDGERTGVKHTSTHKYSDEPHTEPKSRAKSQSSAEKKEKAPAQKFSSKGTSGMKDGKKFDNTKKETIGEASEAQKAARAKFMSMVKGKKEKNDDKEEVKESSKPDFLDMDKDGDKKEPMKSAAADKKKGATHKMPDGTTMAGKEHGDKKSGMSAKQEKFFGKKKTVKESIDSRLSFKQMVQLVQESGGQQQIDPMDKALFTWAERVAKAKLGEGTKSELFAGLIYERNGGRFEMYDVLSEDQK